MVSWTTGALAGLAATGVMTLVELAAWSQLGYRVLLDWWLNQETVARLLKRHADEVTLGGLGMHFLHGLLAGLVFVWVLPLFPSWISATDLGLAYGLVLLGITLIAFRPITGQPAHRGPYGKAAIALALLTHVVFGAVLALLVVSF